MKRLPVVIVLLLVAIGFSSYISAATKKIVSIWIFGDSTVKSYNDTGAYDTCSSILRISGWGEQLGTFLSSDSLAKVLNTIDADSVIIRNRSNGGRAAKAFINGADTAILRRAYDSMAVGDYMFIQFGHNDETIDTTHPERQTPIGDFKMYIGMYVDSVLKKGATPILVTPMVRYTWPEYNTHDNSDGASAKQEVGNYSLVMQEVAKEKGVACIDLTQRSIDLFNSLDTATVKYQYFRKVLNTTCAKLNDNTHFQPNGAKELCRQIFYGLQNLYKVDVSVTDTTRGTVSGLSNGVKNKANTTFLQLTNNFSNGPGWYENKYNSTVQITATAKKGYKFAGWTGDITDTTNPYTLTMNKNYTIVANFADSQSTSVIARKAVSNDRFYQIVTGSRNAGTDVNLILECSANVGAIVFDLQGRTVMSMPMKKMNGGYNTIHLSGIHKSGIYVCRLKINDQQFTHEFVIQ